MNIDPVLLYRFTVWANDHVLTGARTLSVEQLNAPVRPEFLSTLGLLVHIMAAERAWLSRWKGDSPARLLTVDDVPTLEALQRAWSPLRVEMLDFITSVENPNQVLVYHSTKGEEYRNVLWHLILHMVNHGTEHRSQAALYMAAQGIDLGSLDFVYYVRSIA